MGLLANLQVSGDLAGLVRSFLEEQKDTDCDLYRYLLGFQPSSRISFRQWWDLLDQLQLRYPQCFIGIALGLRMRPEFVGVLGHLLLSSDTLAQALQGFERYQRLLHDGDRAVTRIQDDLLCLSWTTDYGPSSRLSDEVLITGMLTFVRRMVGDERLAAAAVHFSFSEPPEAEALAGVCGCDVRFSQASNAVFFHPQQLSLPVSKSNTELKQLLEQQAQALMEVLPQEDLFTVRLREAMLAALHSGQPFSGVVAARLHLSERTLFRRLSGMGVTFREVLTQIRLQLAKEYLLEGRLTQSEIALLLGYSEQSAFNRAFRLACGQPPLSWLKSQRRSV